MNQIIECKCKCHYPTKGCVLKHIMPCCKPCPTCGRNFREGLDEHKELCQPRSVVIIEEQSNDLIWP